METSKPDTALTKSFRVLRQEEILKRVNEISERLAKATPGPEIHLNNDDLVNYVASQREFMMHAREDVAFLLGEVTRLLAVVAYRSAGGV